MPVEFFVPGLPSPQGSHTAIMRGGRATVIPAGTTKSRRELKAWREAVAQVASMQGVMYDEPVSLVLDFYLPVVASDPHRHRHATTPDADKLVRAVLDGLTGTAIVNDSRVWALMASKVHAEPTGCHVVIRPDGEAERASRQGKRLLSRTSITTY